MADVISRLRLDSGEFDSKIKRAGQEIMAYSEHCRKMGLEMGYANKDAKDFAKSLGSMQTVSTSARGKINELSDAFVNLKVMYKNLTDEEKNNTFGKNLASSLDQLKVRIQNAKEDLADVTAELNGKSSAGGGFLSGIGSKMEGALAVFGGNMMTKAAGAVAQLGSEMYGMVQQGIEMARAGEGVRIAFERLGRGDILDGLREATHGTVTDLELMKAAVKFNDFKLPVEELGTMLAFAQQKAKDTGQSVDYMVDSIVTGLGRKSLMILDNLGLSATEVKDKMKQTGDMTKAVGAIIREQMAKAGDYVETAADRAAQANVSLQNKMEELGRKFAPVEEASNQLWTSMKIGILDIVGGPLARLLNGLTEAGRLKNMLNDLNGEGDNTNVGNQLKKLQVIKKAGGSSYMFNSTLSGMVEDYNRQIMALDAQIKNGGKPIGGGSGSSQDVRYLQRQMDALKIMRDELKKGAQGILNSNTQNTTTPTTTTTNGTKTEQTELQKNQAKINALTQEYVKLGDESTEAVRERQAEIQKEIERLQQLNGLLALRAEQAQGRLTLSAGDFQRDGLSNTPGTLLKAPNTTIPSGGLQLDDKAMKALTKNLEKQQKKDEQKEVSLGKEVSNIAGGVSSVFSGLQQLGIELPEGLQNVLGGVQAITTILTGIATTVLAIEAIAGADALIPFANGGIVPHAANGLNVVGGTHYSGDVTPILANAGEVVLNHSQVNTLAQNLQGGGLSALNLTATIKGEQIRLALNNNGRRTGRGEYVQSRNVK